MNVLMQSSHHQSRLFSFVCVCVCVCVSVRWQYSYLLDGEYYCCCFFHYIITANWFWLASVNDDWLLFYIILFDDLLTLLLLLLKSWFSLNFSTEWIVSLIIFLRGLILRTVSLPGQFWKLYNNVSIIYCFSVHCFSGLPIWLFEVVIS